MMSTSTAQGRNEQVDMAVDDDNPLDAVLFIGLLESAILHCMKFPLICGLFSTQVVEFVFSHQDQLVHACSEQLAAKDDSEVQQKITHILLAQTVYVGPAVHQRIITSLLVYLHCIFDGIVKSSPVMM